MTLSPQRKELTKKFNFIKKNYIEPFFKKYGFEKEKGEYVQESSQIHWSINIQKGSWDSEGVLSFALNWSLYVPGYRSFYGRPEDEVPGGFLGTRVGTLTYERDNWWKIKLQDEEGHLNQCGTSVIDLLEQEFVAQLMNKIHTLEDVIEFLKRLRDRPQNHVVVCGKEKALEHLAILYALQGNKQKALESIEEAITILKVKLPHCVKRLEEIRGRILKTLAPSLD